VLAAAFPGEMSSQDRNCAAAMQMFRARRWSEAAAGFEECEKRDPGKTDALLYRGKSLVNLHEFDEAATTLQTYAKLHSQSDDAVYLLAFIFFRKDKPQESLQLFSQAAKLKPPSANDLTIVALDYVLLTDYNDAAHYLELALKMNPDDLDARYHLGRVRYQQNQFDLAIEAFQTVIQRDPANVKAEDNLGLSLEAKNQPDAAVAAYERAIQLDQAASSHNAQPYLNLGSLMAKSNRFDEAISLLTRASEIAPGDFKVRYELGKAYFDSGQFAPARQQAVEAIQLNPKDSSGHYLLGRIYQRLRQKDLANEQFRLTSELIRDNGATSRGMATGTASQH
jgi:tetratricopeptide (TPR) repeat protein